MGHTAYATIAYGVAGEEGDPWTDLGVYLADRDGLDSEDYNLTTQLEANAPVQIEHHGYEYSAPVLIVKDTAQSASWDGPEPLRLPAVIDDVKKAEVISFCWRYDLPVPDSWLLFAHYG